MVHTDKAPTRAMEPHEPAEDRPRRKQLTAKEHTARDLDLHQAKLAAHQAYLAGLNPASLKAADARRQIQLWEEELLLKSDRIAG